MACLLPGGAVGPDLGGQQSPAAPVLDGVYRLIANHHDLAIFESAPEVRALSSASITRLQRSYDPVRLPPWPPPCATSRPLCAIAVSESSQPPKAPSDTSG